MYLLVAGAATASAAWPIDRPSQVSAAHPDGIGGWREKKFAAAVLDRNRLVVGDWSFGPHYPSLSGLDRGCVWVGSRSTRWLGRAIDCFWILSCDSGDIRSGRFRMAKNASIGLALLMGVGTNAHRASGPANSARAVARLVFARRSNFEIRACFGGPCLGRN